MARRKVQSEEPPAGWQPTQPVPDPILNSPYDPPAQHWVYQDGRPFVPAGTAARELLVHDEEGRHEQAGPVRRRRTRRAGPRQPAAQGRRTLAREPARPTRRHAVHERAARLVGAPRQPAPAVLLPARGDRDADLPARTRAPRSGGVRSPLRWKLGGGPRQLRQLLAATSQPSPPTRHFFPRLSRSPGRHRALPLRRLGCKMATGSGKTTVMAMLITWAFVNRGRNPATTQLPERRARLRAQPHGSEAARRCSTPRTPTTSTTCSTWSRRSTASWLNAGKVLVTNWHVLALEERAQRGRHQLPRRQQGRGDAGRVHKDRLGELAARFPSSCSTTRATIAGGQVAASEEASRT